MGFKMRLFIIIGTLVFDVAHTKQPEPDNVLDVVRSLKKEWAIKFEEQDRKLTQQQNEITRLKRKNVEQGHVVIDLKKKTEEQESEVIVLKKDIIGLKNLVAQLKNTESEQKNDAEELNKISDKRDMQVTEPQVLKGNKYTRRKTERQTAGRVAFSLYLSHDQEHTGIGQKIKFDAVLLNEGNGYNPSLGAFTAPASGLYLFAYSVAKWRTGQAFIRLMKNGNAINGAVVEVTTNHEYHQAGNVAVVELDVGDVVYVEDFARTDVVIYGSSTHRWTAFSGVLLI